VVTRGIALLLVGCVMSLWMSARLRRFIEARFRVTWIEVLPLPLGLLVAAVLTMYVDSHLYPVGAGVSVAQWIAFWISIGCGIYMIVLAVVSGRRRRLR
jgi:hypothetical protein